MTNFHLDPTANLLEIEMEEAYLDGDLPSGKLTVANWEAIEIKQYRLESEDWANVDPANGEAISEILEQTFTEDQVVLKGFGVKTHHWTEHLFVNPEAYFEFNPNDA